MVEFPHEFVFPQYNGGSICNILPSILKVLGGDSDFSTLDESFFPISSIGRVSKVVLFVLDAFGYKQLESMIKRHAIPLIEKIAEKGGLSEITSTFPTTTTTALSSIYTGAAPIGHGVFGYHQLIKELGTVANMISLTPVLDGERDRLLKFGLDPKKFLWCPSMDHLFRKNLIESLHLIKRAYGGSGLSRIFFKGSLQTFFHLSDMMLLIKEKLENSQGKLFLTAYWDDIDPISHIYGPFSKEVLEETGLFFYSLENILIKNLSKRARKETLLIITSDHGQIEVSKKEAVRLSRYPFIKRSLLIQPTGEFRSSYLYVKRDKIESLYKYLSKNFPSLWVVKSEEAIKMGLFGETEPKFDPMERVGDILVVPKGRGIFAYLPEKEPLLGRHGGLSKEEMIVPFLWVRTDSIS